MKWCSMLNLPGNHEAFNVLSLQRVDLASVEVLLRPINTIIAHSRERREVGRLVGMLLTHDPVCFHPTRGQCSKATTGVQMKPKHVFFPFLCLVAVRLSPSNPVQCFELALHCLLNIVHLWVTEAPAPSIFYAHAVTQIFAAEYPQLSAKLEDMSDVSTGGQWPSMGDLCWGISQSLFSTAFPDSFAAIWEVALTRLDAHHYVVAVAVAILGVSEKAVCKSTVRTPAQLFAVLEEPLDERTKALVLRKADRIAAKLDCVFTGAAPPLVVIPKSSAYYPSVLALKGMVDGGQSQRLMGVSKKSVFKEAQRYLETTAKAQGNDQRTLALCDVTKTQLSKENALPLLSMHSAVEQKKEQVESSNQKLLDQQTDFINKNIDGANATSTSVTWGDLDANTQHGHGTSTPIASSLSPSHQDQAEPLVVGENTTPGDQAPVKAEALPDDVKQAAAWLIASMCINKREAGGGSLPGTTSSSLRGPRRSLGSMGSRTESTFGPNASNAPTLQTNATSQPTTTGGAFSMLEVNYSERNHPQGWTITAPHTKNKHQPHHSPTASSGSRSGEGRYDGGGTSRGSSLS